MTGQPERPPAARTDRVRPHNGTVVQGGTPHPAVGVAERVVASYERHPDAVRAMDRLAAEQFPVDRAAILGRNLRRLERLTGRIGAGTATSRGALSGGLVGAATGWLLVLIELARPVLAAFWLVVVAAIIGGLVGAGVSLLAYAATRGRRRFTATTAMHADHYDVVVDAELADRAVRLLDAEPDTVVDRTVREG